MNDCQFCHKDDDGTVACWHMDAAAEFADKFEVVGGTVPEGVDADSYLAGCKEILEMIDAAPTIDAVEVVRCKDCINRDQAFRCIALYFGFNPHDDWFCANGKRDAEVE